MPTIKTPTAKKKKEMNVLEKSLNSQNRPCSFLITVHNSSKEATELARKGLNQHEVQS
jgi:hypothetical protein